MNTLTPTLGSNQFITKFDSVPKKKKLKFKVKFLTKVQIIAVILLFTSLYLNYHLITDNYVWTCTASFDGIEQTQWGHFGHIMKKTTCDEIVQMKLETLTISK